MAEGFSKVGTAPKTIRELRAVQEHLGKRPDKDLSRQFSLMIYNSKIDLNESLKNANRAEQYARVLLADEGGDLEKLRRKFTLIRSYIREGNQLGVDKVQKQIRDFLENNGIDIDARI